MDTQGEDVRVEPRSSETGFVRLFPPEAWRRPVALATRVELAAGSVLLRQGDPAEPLYFVEEGSFEIVDPRSAPETVISVVGPGRQEALAHGSYGLAGGRAIRLGIGLAW